MIRGLPPTGTAYARALHGEAGQWQPADWMLADLIDLAHEHLWSFVAAHRGDKTPVPARPAPARRPSVPDAATAASTPPAPPPARRVATSAEVIAFFGGPQLSVN